MVTGAPPTIVAQRQFVINAHRQRVANLLTRALYQSLPLERMNIVDDKTFQADLNWRVAFVPIRLHLEGKFLDVSLPESLSCRLAVHRGMLRLGITVTFTLKAASDGPSGRGRTAVTCAAVAGGAESASLLARLLRRQQRTFAGDAFDAMRARLEQLCAEPT